MDIRDELELQDCPFCGGPGLLEEENGWCWYVMCTGAAGLPLLRRPGAAGGGKRLVLVCDVHGLRRADRARGV